MDIPSGGGCGLVMGFLIALLFGAGLSLFLLTGGEDVSEEVVPPPDIIVITSIPVTVEAPMVTTPTPMP